MDRVVRGVVVKPIAMWIRMAMVFATTSKMPIMMADVIIAHVRHPAKVGQGNAVATL